MIIFIAYGNKLPYYGDTFLKPLCNTRKNANKRLPAFDYYAHYLIRKIRMPNFKLTKYIRFLSTGQNDELDLQFYLMSPAISLNFQNGNGK